MRNVGTRGFLGTTVLVDEGIVVTFTGSGMGYFRVWFVNVVFSALSFGLYSPWATVRKLRYFSEHTVVDGEPLAFTGRAAPLLFGRFVLSVILGCWFLVTLFPWIALVVAAGLAAIPWLLVLRSRFYVGAYSLAGRPFCFRGRVSSSYKVYLSLVLVSALTFLIGLPWGWFLHRRFVLENTWYGEERIQFRGDSLGFLRCYLPAFVAALFSLLVWTGIVYLVGPERMEEFRVWPWLLLYSLPFYLVFLFCMASIKARLGNYVWNRTALGARSFRADFETMDLFGIYIQNSFLVLVSAGLAWPWAMVNLHRYRADRLELISL